MEYLEWRTRMRFNPFNCKVNKNVGNRRSLGGVGRGWARASTHNSFTQVTIPLTLTKRYTCSTNTDRVRVGYSPIRIHITIPFTHTHTHTSTTV